MKKILIALLVLPFIFACSSDDSKELDKALVGIWGDTTYTTEVDVEPSELKEKVSEWILSDTDPLVLEFKVSGDLTYTNMTDRESYNYKVWTEDNILFITENGKTLSQVQYSVKDDTFVMKEDMRREIIEDFEDMGEKIKVNKAVLVTTMRKK